MFEINGNFSWRLREKRAKNRLTITKTAQRIGISRRTLGLIESGEKDRISKDVYLKIIEWLLEDNNEEDR